MAQAPVPRRQSAARPRQCPYVRDRRAGDPSSEDETLRKPGYEIEYEPTQDEVTSHSRLWYGPNRDAILEAGYGLTGEERDPLKYSRDDPRTVQRYTATSGDDLKPNEPVALPFQSNSTIKAFLVGAQALYPNWFDPAACAIEPSTWDDWGVGDPNHQSQFASDMQEYRGATGMEGLRVTFGTRPWSKAVPRCSAWPIADQLFDEVVVDGKTKQVVDKKELVHYSDWLLRTVWKVMTPTRRAATIELGWKLMDLEGSPRSSDYVLLERWNQLSMEEKQAFGLGVQTAYAKSFDEDACTFRMQDVIDESARDLALPTPSVFCNESGGKFDPETGGCFYLNQPGLAPVEMNHLGKMVSVPPDRCQVWPGEEAELISNPGEGIPNVTYEKRESLLAALWRLTHPDQRRWILDPKANAVLKEPYTGLNPRHKRMFALHVARANKSSLGEGKPKDHITYKETGCALETERLMKAVGHYPGPGNHRGHGVCHTSRGGSLGSTSDPKNGGPVVCTYKYKDIPW